MCVTVEQYIERIRQITALLLIGFEPSEIVERGFDVDLVGSTSEHVNTVRADTGGKFPKIVIRYTEDET